MKAPRIAVVIPAFRTERHIAEVIDTLPDFVSLVVVVDDRSPDRTAEIVRALQPADSRIVLHCHPTNQGVGGAVLSGYAVAREHGAEIIVKMDGDGQMDPAHLARLVDPIVRGRADYTKGNRFLHARELLSMPPLRRIGNLGLSFLTKLASGYWNVFDPTNGYTALHAGVLDCIDTDCIGRRYFFESSMLIELGVAGAVVEDVPIPARYGDEVSSLSVARTLSEFPGQLLRGCLRRIWIQHFVRDFSALALLLTAGLGLATFGALWGAAWWLESWRTGVVTSTGTVMLSVLPLILGVQCLLQCLLLDLQSVPRGAVHRMAARTPVFPRIVRPEDQPGEIPVGRLEEGMHGAVGSEYQVSGRRAA